MASVLGWWQLWLDGAVKICPSRRAMEEVFGTVRQQILAFLDSEEAGGCIELEARLGRICSPITNERIVLNTQHPVIIGRNARGVVFKSGVEQAFFERAKAHHSEASPTARDDTVYILHDNIRKIVSGSSTVYQRKTRSRHVTIYCPGCSYDVRVSFSMETDVPPDEVGDVPSEVTSSSGEDNASLDNDGDEKEKRRRVACRALHVRHRKRESYVYGDYVADFTSVNRSKTPGKNNNLLYEVEIEVTGPGYSKEDFASMILNLPRGE